LIGLDYLREQLEESQFAFGGERRQDPIFGQEHRSAQALARPQAERGQPYQTGTAVRRIRFTLDQALLIEVVQQLAGIGPVDTDPLAQATLINPGVPVDCDQHCVLERHQALGAHNLIHRRHADLLKAPYQMERGAMWSRERPIQCVDCPRRYSGPFGHRPLPVDSQLNDH
jgi:hypothetical protein